MKFEIRCIRCLRVLRGEVKKDTFDCWLCGATNSLSHDNAPITVKIGPQVHKLKASESAKKGKSRK